jgi:hypothetical protein
MLGNQGQAAEAVQMLAPLSAAATANATSAWIDVRKYEGDLVIVSNIGIITGTITPTIEDATDGSGTGAAGITPNEGAYAAGAANQIQKRTLNASAVRGWVRCVGTIVTGPALVAVNIKYHRKFSTPRARRRRRRRRRRKARRSRCRSS